MDTIGEKALKSLSYPCIGKLSQSVKFRSERKVLTGFWINLSLDIGGLSLVTSKTIKLERERELAELERVPYSLLLKGPIS
jgi:hypothetical protein